MSKGKCPDDWSMVFLRGGQSHYDSAMRNVIYVPLHFDRRPPPASTRGGLAFALFPWGPPPINPLVARTVILMTDLQARNGHQPLVKIPSICTTSGERINN